MRLDWECCGSLAGVRGAQLAGSWWEGSPGAPLGATLKGAQDWMWCTELPAPPPGHREDDRGSQFSAGTSWKDLSDPGLQPTDAGQCSTALWSANLLTLSNEGGQFP